MLESNKILKEEISERKISNKILEEFAYATSHNLKEPLRGISGYITFFLEDYSDGLDEDGKSYLNQIEKRINKMNLLIDTLLEISHIGRQRINPINIDINKLLIELLNSMKFIELPNKTSNSEYNFEDKFKNKIYIQKLPIVLGDPIQIRLVLKNIISNGLNFHKKDNLSIIKIKADSNKNYHTISITDNGIGIEKNYCKTIFQSFQKLNYSSCVGVGLALSKKIIDRHGGSIWCESKINQGSTFYFTLKNIVIISK